MPAKTDHLEMSRQRLALFGAAVKKLLSTRAKGSTVPHGEVRGQVREIIGRHSRKECDPLA
jgi:hypothetical protein